MKDLTERWYAVKEAIGRAMETEPPLMHHVRAWNLDQPLYNSDGKIVSLSPTPVFIKCFLKHQRYVPFRLTCLMRPGFPSDWCWSAPFVTIPMLSDPDPQIVKWIAFKCIDNILRLLKEAPPVLTPELLRALATTGLSSRRVAEVMGVKLHEACRLIKAAGGKRSGHSNLFKSSSTKKE